MKTSVIWSGISNHSIEHCLIEENQDGNLISSTIIGTYQKQIYKVDYCIQTDKYWNTLSVKLKADIDLALWDIELQKHGYNWMLNDKLIAALDGVADVDISLTPFTNTLPIKRIAFKEQNPAIIEVVYFDVLGHNILPVKQIYTQVSSDEYIYQNLATSFSAHITTDPQGLVKSYPKLFKMTIKNIQSVD